MTNTTDVDCLDDNDVPLLSERLLYIDSVSQTILLFDHIDSVSQTI